MSAKNKKETSLFQDLLTPSWYAAISSIVDFSAMETLASFVEQEYSQKTIYPAKENIFYAFNSLSIPEIRVVILGQDPYHGANQGHGLSFSVLPGIKHPPSLRNIFTELYHDLQVFPPPKTFGHLTKWSQQGVFLLNTVLTVEESKPNSHKDKGWEKITDAAIQLISDLNEHVIFVLWGKHAQSKTDLIDSSKHYIIQSAHPSPFSAHRGFFGSKPFSKINAQLINWNEAPIDWKIE